MQTSAVAFRFSDSLATITSTIKTDNKRYANT